MNTKGTLLVDLHSTFLRMSKLLAEEISQISSRPVGAIYFDAHEDDESFPDGDQVGISGLTFDIEQGFVDGTVMIGMATQTDANLFRLIRGLNTILSAVMPGERVDVVDGESGSPVGWINFVDGTRLMPVTGKASRPIQFVSVQFVTALDYRPE